MQDIHKSTQHSTWCVVSILKILVIAISGNAVAATWQAGVTAISLYLGDNLQLITVEYL